MNILRPRYEYCDRLYPAGYIEAVYEDCSLSVSSASSIGLLAQGAYQTMCAMTSVSLSTSSPSRIRSAGMFLVSSVASAFYYGILKNLSIDVVTSLICTFIPSALYSLSFSSSATSMLYTFCKRMCSFLSALASQLQFSATADILKAIKVLVSSISSSTLQVLALRGLSFLSSSVSSISYRLSWTVNFIVAETASLSTAFRMTLLTAISLILSQVSQLTSASVIIKSLRIIESLQSSVSYSVSNIIRTVKQIFAPLGTVRFTQTIIYCLATSVSSKMVSLIHICRMRALAFVSQTVSYIYIALLAWRERLIYTSRIVLALWNKSPITTTLKKFSVIKQTLSVTSKVGRLYGKDI